MKIGLASSNKNYLKLYTDGACKGNPGPGGWAYLVKNDDGVLIAESSGAVADTTNNRMELMAVIEGIGSISEGSIIDVYTDSRYIVDAFKLSWLDNWKNNHWRTSSNGDVKNKDLWLLLDNLVKTRKVQWFWVKGHSKHPENDRVDFLASEKANSLVLGR